MLHAVFQWLIPFAVVSIVVGLFIGEFIAAGRGVEE